MFHIFPIQDEETRCAYAAACRTVPRDDHLSFGMVCVEDGQIMGFSQFTIGAGQEIGRASCRERVSVGV